MYIIALTIEYLVRNKPRGKLNMFKKHSISVISIILMLSFCATAFGASFTDVTSDFSWAVEAIDEMSEKGIINGYNETTFGPADGITKIQAMLLISRILGCNEAVYAPYIEDIKELTEISSLDVSYEKELAFLIYKGIFSAEEIAKLSAELDSVILRYEASEYITRAMGKYETVKASYSSYTGYADENEIPEAYRPFVTYTKDAALLQGTGENQFSPTKSVTRAQMAVLLNRVLKNLSLNTFEADIVSYQDAENSLKVTLGSTEGSYDTSDASFYYNGEKAESSAFREGESVILVFENGVLTRIEKITEEEAFDPSTIEASVVNGKVTELKLADNYLRIENSQTGEVERYFFTEGCQADVDGITRTLSAIRTKDHVQLSLNTYGEVLKVSILDISDSFTGGTITAISTKYGLYITIEDNKGVETTYTTTDNVAVVRNSSNAQLSDVLVGDTVVSCDLSYNRISVLKVKSITSSSSGSIVEILISAEPSIVIDGKRGETRYSISDNIKITVDGSAAEIYDLRLGMNAEVALDSNTITKITVTSPQDAGQFSGTVNIINTAYGFINMTLSDGTEKQVFVKNTTKIHDDNTGRERNLSTLSEGDNLVVIGKTVNGAFQATTIILVAE